MRFDGYYILSDFLEIPNLHDRSFSLARWWLREVLFGLAEPAPEYFTPTRQKLLITFAIFVWIYRLVIFIGIALIVYHFFIKIIGILLFVVEIGWFIARPILNELRFWWARRSEIIKRNRIYRIILIVSLIFVALIFPWHANVSGPAILRGADFMSIYSPTSGQIRAIPVHNGKTIRKGDVLMELSSPDLDYRIEAVERRIYTLEYQLKAAAFDPNFLMQIQTLREQLESSRAELKGLQSEKDELVVLAPFSGHFVDLQPDLRVGQWVSRKHFIGNMINTEANIAWVIIAADQIRRVRLSDEAIFYPEASGVQTAHGRVNRVDPFPLKNLEFPALASIFGGPIDSVQKEKSLVPIGSYYQVVIEFDKDINLGRAHEQRGTAKIMGQPESLLTEFLRSIAAVVVREAGL